jgi:trehalose utilization protein
MTVHEDAEAASRRVYDEAIIAERTACEEGKIADAATIAELQEQVAALQDELHACMDDYNQLVGERHSTDTGVEDEPVQ